MSGLVETPPSFAVGCSVKLRTNDQDELNGKIFAVDAHQRMVLLQDKAERHNTFNFTLVNTDHISEVVEAVPADEPGTTADEPLPEIDPARTQQRFHRALRAAQQASEKIGIGVTRRGQAIFDAVSKTLPCHWDEKNILVLDEVIVEEPYTLDSCRSLHDGDSQLLQRVKLVINSEDGGDQRGNYAPSF